MQPTAEEEEEAPPRPIRPKDMPELFIPPTHGTFAPPPEEDLWNHGVLPTPQAWRRPMGGPHTDQNKRLIQRLNDVSDY